MANGIVTRKGITASLVAEQRLADKLTALLPNASFVVDGSQLTGEQVTGEIRGHISAEMQLAALLRQLTAARAAIKRVRARARTLRQVVKLVAAGTLGDSSKDYQALGFEVPKRRRNSVKAKLVAVVKAKATRTARGTKGSRQKQAIHG
jgi:hypothetical protein